MHIILSGFAGPPGPLGPSGPAGLPGNKKSYQLMIIGLLLVETMFANMTMLIITIMFIPKMLSYLIRFNRALGKCYVT